MAVRLLHILLIATLALTACATSREPGGEAGVNAPGSRIVVAPLNLAIRAPEEIDCKGERVWRELLSYFQTLDRQVAVLRPSSAERLLLEAMLDLGRGPPQRGPAAWRQPGPPEVRNTDLFQESAPLR